MRTLTTSSLTISDLRHSRIVTDVTPLWSDCSDRTLLTDSILK